MGDESADAAARGLLFRTSSERGAHAVAVQALLARNALLRTNDEVIAEQLRVDPAFRAEWQRTAEGRAVASVLVRYRADHDLSQCELAHRLRMSMSELAGLELGEDTPSAQMLARLSDELGIEPGVNIDPSKRGTR